VVRARVCVNVNNEIPSLIKLMQIYPGLTKVHRAYDPRMS